MIEDLFTNYFSLHYTVEPCGIIRGSDNRKTTVTTVFTKYCELVSKLGYPTQMNMNDVTAYIESITPEPAPIEEEKVVPSDAPLSTYDFCGQFVREHNGKDWRIDSAFRMIECVEEGVPVNSDLNALATAIRVEALKTGLKKNHSTDDIKSCLCEIARKASLNAIVSIANDLEYSPDAMANATEFLRIIHSEWKIVQDVDVFTDIMFHFLWQCKRKLLGLPVVWDILVNIYGGTGIAKTSTVQEIGKPFKDFAIMSTFCEVLDTERQVKKLSECYYINLDELSVGNSADYKYGTDAGTLNREQKTSFKKLMSQRKARTRTMGGQTQTSQRYTFSFIASSNTHLADVIYDETTMRRYVEIECTAENITDYSNIDRSWKLIKDLWRAVDEHNDKGYLFPGSRSWDTVREMQAKYYPTNTTTAAWAKDRGVVACFAARRENLNMLYSDYASFAKSHGNQPKCYENWLKDIKHIIDGAVNEAGMVSICRVDKDPEQSVPQYDSFADQLGLTK